MEMTANGKRDTATRGHTASGAGARGGTSGGTVAHPTHFERPRAEIRALPDPAEPACGAQPDASPIELPRKARADASPIELAAPAEPAEKPCLAQRLRSLAERLPRPPRLSKGAKRALDLVHLLAAAVWLGGFVVALALVVLGGGSGGAYGDLLEAVRRFVLTPCMALLMVSGLLYSLCTNWGFAKHGWVVAKWALSIVAVNCCMHLPMNLTGLLVIVVLIAALFVLSVLKPRRSRGKDTGTGKRPTPYRGRHMAPAATPARRDRAATPARRDRAATPAGRTRTPAMR